jgi:hypothetical protein
MREKVHSQANSSNYTLEHLQICSCNDTLKTAIKIFVRIYSTYISFNILKVTKLILPKDYSSSIPIHREYRFWHKNKKNAQQKINQ